MKNIFVIFLLIILNTLPPFAQDNVFILKGRIKGIRNGEVKLIYDKNIKELNINDNGKIIYKRVTTAKLKNILEVYCLNK